MHAKISSTPELSFLLEHYLILTVCLKRQPWLYPTTAVLLAYPAQYYTVPTSTS